MKIAGVQCAGVSDFRRTRSDGVAIPIGVIDMRVDTGVHGTLLEDIKRRRHISYCLIWQGRSVVEAGKGKAR